MQNFYAAVDGLYDYTVGALFRYFVGSKPAHLPSELGEIQIPEQMPKVVKMPEPPESLPIAEIETEVPTFRTLSTVIDARKDVEGDLSRTVGYVGSARAPLFIMPTKELDTVITTLSYGAMVMVLEERGRFSKVAENGVVGWILREDLADRAAYVYPEFVIGEENNAEDPNTERLRACIKDEFHGTEAEVSLQASEYVLYKLMRKGLSINWPPVRPRTPGQWHSILRGTPGIHIGIAAKTGSIMEYTLENDTGHLAYVEAVFPDERVTLSEANYPDRGIYSERTLTKEEWQALNPIFISVS